MSIEILTALVAFAFVSSITPGPNNLMLMASGTNFGFTRTMPHMFGVCIGFTIMVILVGAGLMNLFEAWPLSFTVLRVLSVTYLLYLAWKIATATPLSGNSQENKEDGRPLTFLQAAMFQWVNPKAWAMALTAISAYAPESGALHGVLLVALVLAAINLPSISTWVVLGTQLRRWLTDPLKLRVFNVVAAILLLGSLYPIFFPTVSG